MSEAFRFSIVVPVKNDEKNIFKCLDSLTRLSGTAGAFEVIVVDNGSTDRTVEVVNRFRDSLCLTVLTKPDVFISALRNSGGAIAKGSWLVFLDSDCQVRNNWLSEAQAAIDSGCGSIIGSYYEIPDSSTWVARYWFGDRQRKPRGQTPFLPSGDLFFQKDVFERIGGFNEGIQTNEDVEICRRAAQAGFPVFCIPELAVIHWGTPQTLVQFFKKNRWHGKHVLKVFLQNPLLLLNIKPLLLTFYTILCLAGIGASFVLAFLHGNHAPLLLAVLALLVPPCGLGLFAAIKMRSPMAVAPMSILYLVYALARAASLGYARTSR